MRENFWGTKHRGTVVLASHAPHSNLGSDVMMMAQLHHSAVTQNKTPRSGAQSSPHCHRLPLS